MDQMKELSRFHESLRNFMEVETKDKSRFRFTIDDRVRHVTDVQFKEGKERIFASRVQSLHKCASQDNVDGIAYFLETKNWDVNRLDGEGGGEEACKPRTQGTVPPGARHPPTAPSTAAPSVR